MIRWYATKIIFSIVIIHTERLNVNKHLSNVYQYAGYDNTINIGYYNILKYTNIHEIRSPRITNVTAAKSFGGVTVYYYYYKN